MDRLWLRILIRRFFLKRSILIYIVNRIMLVLQPEVVERAALEALAVEVRDELSSRDAPVERRVVAALRDGAVQPRRSLHVRVEEARHRDPRRVPVRQHPVLHAPEPVVADELHAPHGARRNSKQRWIICA